MPIGFPGGAVLIRRYWGRCRQLNAGALSLLLMGSVDGVGVDRGCAPGRSAEGGYPVVDCNCAVGSAGRSDRDWAERFIGGPR